MSIIRPTTINARFSQPVGIGKEKLWLCPTLGGDRLDLSGNGNHGTYNGGMGTVADKSNGGTRAYLLDGLDDNLSCGDVLDNVFTSGVFSISGWIYAPTNDAWILSKAHTSAGRQFYLAVRNHSGTAYVTAVIYDQLTTRHRVYRGSTAIANNSWKHVVMLFDNSLPNTSNVKLWVNGTAETMTLAAQQGTWDNIYDGNANLGIGGWLGPSQQIPFSSRNDDIRVFDRALTTSEIKHLASKRGVLGSPRQPYDPLKRTVVRVPAATPTPSATYHPLRSLAHPLEQ